VKVVEGSEIYNFAIHHLVHFSCKIRVNISQTELPRDVSARHDIGRALALQSAIPRAALHRAPPYARAGAGPRPAVRAPSRGSTPSQAAPAPRRIEVPAPYRGQPHPRAHLSIRCRPVRDAYISGGRPSRRSYVPPPLRLVPQPAALPTRPEPPAGAIGGSRGEPRA
jgi:hypothetical protein